MVHQPGTRVSKEMPTTRVPASSAKAWLPAHSQAPSARRGPAPRRSDPCPRLCGAALPGPGTAGPHLGAASSGAGTPEEGAGGTAGT